MKKLTSIAITFLLVLSVIPAMAGDQTDSQAVDQATVSFQAVDQATVSFQAFQAFSNLSATEREALTPLTDTELAAIEGSHWWSSLLTTPALTNVVNQNATAACILCVGSGAAATNVAFPQSSGFSGRSVPWPMGVGW
jgi:hypothetical protein